MIIRLQTASQLASFLLPLWWLPLLNGQVRAAPPELLSRVRGRSWCDWRVVDQTQQKIEAGELVILLATPCDDFCAVDAPCLSCQ